jgi:hypothetical protein
VPDAPLLPTWPRSCPFFTWSPTFTGMVPALAWTYQEISPSPWSIDTPLCFSSTSSSFALISLSGKPSRTSMTRPSATA